jgi:hypothetical protein
MASAGYYDVENDESPNSLTNAEGTRGGGEQKDKSVFGRTPAIYWDAGSGALTRVGISTSIYPEVSGPARHYDYGSKLLVKP